MPSSWPKSSSSRYIKVHAETIEVESVGVALQAAMVEHVLVKHDMEVPLVLHTDLQSLTVVEAHGVDDELDVLGVEDMLDELLVSSSSSSSSSSSGLSSPPPDGAGSVDGGVVQSPTDCPNILIQVKLNEGSSGNFGKSYSIFGTLGGL